MSNLQSLATCASKRFYDTEFEATIAAAHTERSLGNPMEPYHCPHGTHWHVRNVVKELRGHQEPKYIVCESCHVVVKRTQWRKHMKQHGKQNRQKAAA